MKTFHVHSCSFVDTNGRLKLSGDMLNYRRKFIMGHLGRWFHVEQIVSDELL